MRILNYTPHTVNVFTDSREVRSFASMGSARCTEETIITRNIDGIDISQTTLGEVEGLPDPQPNTMYIVSRLILVACRDTRNDLLVPNEIIRDVKGNIIGCKSLASN